MQYSQSKRSYCHKIYSFIDALTLFTTDAAVILFTLKLVVIIISNDKHFINHNTTTLINTIQY